MSQGWWRRNRRAIAVLPVGLVLVLVTSSQRVGEYWWQRGFHRAHDGVAGEWVDFVDRYEFEGRHERRVRIRFDGFDDVPDGAVIGPGSALSIPEGARALTVNLAFEADPSVPLLGCSIALRDAAGVRYEFLTDIAGVTMFGSPCIPADVPSGPMLGIEHDSDEEERPRSWTSEPIVVLPADVTIREVLVWWDLPEYVRVALPAS